MMIRQIISLFVAVTLIIIAIVACTNVTDYLEGNEQKTYLSTFMNVSEYVFDKEETNTEPYEIKPHLRNEEALIIMNPVKTNEANTERTGFYYENNGQTEALATYMERPEKCGDIRTCVCLCQGFSLKGNNELDIQCEEIQCRSAKYQVQEKVYPNKIIPEGNDIIGDETFWYNSMIVLNSNLIAPGEFIIDNQGNRKKIDIAGYKDYRPNEDTTLYISKLNDKEIKICIDKKC